MAPTADTGTSDAAVVAAPQEVPAEAGSLFSGKLPFWLPVAPLVALDLWSKSAAFAFLRGPDDRFDPHASHNVFRTSWIDFDLVNYLNHGTIWGLFHDWHQPLKYIRLAAIGMILYFVYKTPRSHRVMLVVLGLILAGALGNLYDNFLHVNTLARHLGAVRDFLHFHNRPHWDFPAFNVADSCITVGAGVMLIMLLFGLDQPDRPRAKK